MFDLKMQKGRSLLRTPLLSHIIAEKPNTVNVKSENVQN